jgi:predicted Zn-dependent peptidase
MCLIPIHAVATVLENESKLISSQLSNGMSVYVLPMPNQNKVNVQVMVMGGRQSNNQKMVGMDAWLSHRN